MNYLNQLDFVKGFAAISVIILHSIPFGLLVDTYSVFHIWQAVPLFIIIMGFNLTYSKNAPLYSVKYFYKRYKRILEPFLIIFLLSLVFGFLFYREDYYLGWMNLIGLMPKSGAGNYYITILLQFILLSPILYHFFKKSPKLSVFSLFLIDFLFQIFAMNFITNNYIYSGSIFRYFSALALGMWIAEDYNIKSKRNIWIIVGCFISIFYLLISNTLDTLFFNKDWRSQNLFSFFYPATLILLAINYLPNRLDNKVSKLLSLFGKASYHIFLVQMIYFALIPANSFALKLSETYNYYIVGGTLIVFNLLVCVSIGLLFYKLNKPRKQNLDKVKSLISPN